MHHLNECHEHPAWLAETAGRKDFSDDMLIDVLLGSWGMATPGAIYNTFLRLTNIGLRSFREQGARIR